MTTTIFLHAPRTLRVSFPYSKAAVDAIKSIGGARWDPDSRTWRVPLDRLDALLSVFGDTAAVAPEVFMAADATAQEVAAPRVPATPEQRLRWFMDACVRAGVTLRVEGQRNRCSGGCWTKVLQAEIDKRAAGIIRLIASGWQPPVQAAPAPPSAPADLTLITHMDYVLAAGERNAIANAARKEAMVEGAKRRKRKEVFERIDRQLGLGVGE